MTKQTFEDTLQEFISTPVKEKIQQEVYESQDLLIAVEHQLHSLYYQLKAVRRNMRLLHEKAGSCAHTAGLDISTRSGGTNKRD